MISYANCVFCGIKGIISYHYIDDAKEVETLLERGIPRLSKVFASVSGKTPTLLFCKTCGIGKSKQPLGAEGLVLKYHRMLKAGQLPSVQGVQQ